MQDFYICVIKIGILRKIINRSVYTSFDLFYIKIFFHYANFFIYKGKIFLYFYINEYRDENCCNVQ